MARIIRALGYFVETDPDFVELNLRLQVFAAIVAAKDLGGS
jgi:hypothetical protein